TLSRNQFEYSKNKLAGLPTSRNIEVRLQGWEEFEDKVDRIVTIGAFEAFKMERYPAFFEHFGRQRYGRFFKMAYQALPPGGVMLLHTIVRPSFKDARAKGLKLTHEIVQFSQFILAEIFPGGWLPTPQTVGEYGVTAGFDLTRVQSLQLHYARTLDLWAEALEANREQAIAIQSQEVYD
ncbi:class I SAM-dependent methyltransferase, partial [Mycobacterium sp. 1482292.6]|uniref:class I SAM-dependent methyltransferase n=1 Tax=Mycobacterium sp. 1482292.6 TaxID=1834081 RepID=UPI000ACDD954